MLHSKSHSNKLSSFVSLPIYLHSYFLEGFFNCSLETSFANTLAVLFIALMRVTLVEDVNIFYSFRETRI